MVDRPWIKDTVTSGGDLTFQNGGLSWDITIRSENIGHSVATAIFPQVKLITIQGADFIDGPRQQAKELCGKASERFEKVKNYPSVWGNAIFPTEHRDSPSSLILWPPDVDKASFNGGPFLAGALPPC